jgi:hypothetical protein
MRRAGRAWAGSAALLLVVLAARVAAARDAAPQELLFAAEYREALRSWLQPQEQTRLDAIPRVGATQSRERALYLATDRSVRVLLPLLLEATDRRDEANRLRRLAPIKDRRSAVAAEEVVRTMKDRDPPTNPGPLHPCRGPIQHATLQVNAATRPNPASYGTATSMVACSAVQSGAPRTAVVDAALALLSDLAAAR